MTRPYFLEDIFCCSYFALHEAWHLLFGVDLLGDFCWDMRSWDLRRVVRAEHVLHPPGLAAEADCRAGRNLAV